VADEDRTAFATPDFWADTYLAAYELPYRVSEDVPFERSLIRELAADAPVARGDRLLELGCAPGRWLVWYAERFGADVEGVEYTPFGADQTRANLAACGVEGTVHEVDFWDFEPAERYDVVLSLGFIEHFGNVEGAFRRHVDLVAPGGRLVLTVPNFQGVNRRLAKFCDPDWLALHNLDAIGDRPYLGRAERAGVQVRSMRYVGGFDPDMISVRKRGRKLLAPIWHARHRRIGDRLNAWWLSTFLLMVFERPVAQTTG
jgi:SAM-dependent methyltransferase